MLLRLPGALVHKLAFRAMMILAMAAPALAMQAGGQPRPAAPLGWRAEPRDLQVPFERVDRPAISPDGSLVAFSALDSDDRAHIQVVATEGGEPRAVTSGPADDHSPRFSADGRMVAFVSNRSGNADIWVAPVGGGPARQVTDDPADDLDPEWSPDGARLVFSSNRSGALLLYMVSATGGQVFPISAGSGPDRRAAWSPDGQWLAFESRRDGDTHVWVIPAYGGEARRATTGKEPEWAPSWSYDSRRIRLFGTRSRSLVLTEAPLEGNEPVRTFGLRIEADPAQQPPALSRTGDRMALLDAGKSGIGLLNFQRPSGSGQTVIESAGVNRDPSWAADGRRIVFLSDRNGRRDIYIAGISTGRVARVTDTEVRESSPSWSAGGDIAVSIDSPTGTAIWVVEPATSKKILVVAEPGRHRQPAWSPDGKLIAYVSDAGGGGDDIYVAQVSDSTTRKLTSLAGAESHPTWSPDGTWIAFAREQSGPSEIWKVPLDGSAAPVKVSGPPVPGVSCLNPNWSANNAWIAFNCLVDGGSALFMAPPGGGKPVQIYRPLNLRVSNPAWSPDASYLAYQWSKPDHLMVMDLPTE